MANGSKGSKAGKIAAYVGLALCALLVALPFGLRVFVIEAYRVPAESMLPTLQVGDHFFVDKWTGRDVSPGEVIVFRHPDKPHDYVKRLIARGGDRVRVHDGQVFLNGAPVRRTATALPKVDQRLAECAAFEEQLGDRKYVTLDCGQGTDTATITVPEDHVFVLGDNRDNSADSRMWGTVPRENIKGAARWIWWSADTARMGAEVD